MIKYIKGRIAHYQHQLKMIQEECSHPSACVTKTHGSSTGNPYETNEYWTDFECSLCEKRWTEDGSL